MAETVWLTRKQAAAHAGVSETTIDAWRQAGLPSPKIGRVVRIRQDDLDTFMNTPKEAAAA